MGDEVSMPLRPPLIWSNNELPVIALPVASYLGVNKPAPKDVSDPSPDKGDISNLVVVLVGI